MKIKNSAGFSLVETMIAFGVLAIIATLAISSFWKIMDLQRVSERRTDTDLTKALIMTGLSDSAHCASILQDHITGTTVKRGTTTTVDVNSIVNPLTPVFVSGAASTLSTGPTYTLTLVPAPTPDTTFPTDFSRPLPTERYLETLSLSGTIKGVTTSSVTSIPISMEYDTSPLHTLVSCTVQPDDTDEVLYSNGGVAHTARQCQVDGGTPFPTDIGVLCRFPINVIKTGTPAGATCKIGWTNAPGYISTISRDYYYQNCGGHGTDWRGWHYLSRANGGAVESWDLTIKNGTSASYSWTAFAGSSGGSVVLASILGLSLNPIFGAGVILGFALGFVFSFTNCKNQTIPVAAQQIGAGCY